jgi:hypothetical protein
MDEISPLERIKKTFFLKFGHYNLTIELSVKYSKEST